MTRTSDLIGEISEASKEQATGIQQISLAMVQLNGVTQSNASASEQLAATAETLSDQARFLDVAMAQFRLEGERTPITPSRAERARQRRAEKELAAPS